MKFIFDSTDEIAAFYDEFLSDGEGNDGTDTAANGTGKRKRRTKAQIEADKAAASAAGPGFAPPPPAQTAAAFAPPPGPATSGFAAPATAQQGFPLPATVAPAANPLAQKIIDRVNLIVAGGHGGPAQPLEQCVGWLRTTLPGAGQANWEQMTASFLPNAPEPVLQQVASALGVPA